MALLASRLAVAAVAAGWSCEEATAAGRPRQVVRAVGREQLGGRASPTYLPVQ